MQKLSYGINRTPHRCGFIHLNQLLICPKSKPHLFKVRLYHFCKLKISDERACLDNEAQLAKALLPVSCLYGTRSTRL
jgi:hypothetical protein